MSPAIRDFWKRTVKSGLISPDEGRRLAREFAASNTGSAARSATALAQWLVDRRHLTRYQAQTLLAARKAPFFLGDYKIQRPISRGRLKGLLRCIHVPTGQPVCLYIATKADDRGGELLAAAARAAQRRHPQLARVYHGFETGGRVVVVLEDLHGATLAEKMQKTSNLPPTVACRIARDVARGLAPFVAEGAAHGAVYPRNVWIAGEGSGDVKLLGFPLCGPDAPADRATATAAEPTTPDGSSTQHERATDLRSDVYGLGATLYHMLIGHPPAQGDPLSDPRALDDLPAPLAKLLGFLLAANPEQRYRDAGAAAEALALFAGSDSQTPRPEPPTPAALAYEKWLAERTTPAFERPTSEQEAEPAQTPAAIFGSSGDSDASDAVETENAATAPAEEVPDTAALEISTDDDPRLSRYRRGGARSRRRSPLAAAIALGSVGVMAAALVVAWIKLPVFDSQRPVPANAEAAPEVPRTPTAAAEPPTTTADNSALWESPTSGTPLDLAYLANGARAIVAWRVAAMLEHAEGEKLLAAMGPILDQQRAELTAAIGLPLEHIEQLLVGMLPSESGWARCFVVRPREPVDQEQMLAAWNNPSPAEIDGHSVFRGGELGYWLVDNDGEARIVIAPWNEMERIVRGGDYPPVLRREIEALVPATDRERMFTLLSTSSALLRDRDSILPVELNGLKLPLEAFLGRGIQAMLVSCHLDEDLFLELRVVPRADQQPLRLAGEYRQQVEEVPQRVDERVASLSSTDYSRPILERLPRMMDVLAMYTRVETDGSQVVLRTYLPAAAAHNLALATRLSLLEADKVPGEPSAPAAMRLDERLATTVTLRFPRQTLETALAMLGEEIGVPIEILGGDLQLEGITRNQSFGLDLEAITAREALWQILLRASPDGKLVYTVKPDAASGRETIYVTTRTAAQQRGDPLPPDLPAAGT